MRIVDGLPQNSAAWLAYRRSGIGASDAPALMNESPYGTPFSLWAEKTGLLKREEPNAYALAAMERGKRLEPEARFKFEARIGAKFPAINVMHDEHDFIKASLDGWEAVAKAFVEIKSPSKVEHAKALKAMLKKTGEVTPKYKAQIEQQFLITGAKKAYFVSYYPDYMGSKEHELAIVEIRPDPAYQARLLAALIDMWQRVQAKTPPPVGPEDLMRIVNALLPLHERLTGALEALRLLGEAFTSQTSSKT